jgi:ATP-dependent helicase/nuclease subunit A
MLNQQRLSETTNLQQMASNPKYSVFVSASAGSGKTKVLKDRFLRLLLEGNSPDKIMCLTFTKVAAKEMQKRIFNELSQWLFLPESDLKQNLFKLDGKNLSPAKIKKSRNLFAQIIDNINELKINTIHSFCQNIIQQFPLEADISPNFEVIDPIVENKILAEAKSEVIKEAQSNKLLKEKITNISEKLNENSFEEIIFSLISKKEKLFSLKDDLINLELIEKKIYQTLEIDKNLSEDDVIKKLRQKCKNFNITGFFQIWQEVKKEKSIAENFIQNPDKENFTEFTIFFLTKKNEKIRADIKKFVIKYFPSWIRNFDKIIAEIFTAKNYINTIDVARYSYDLLFVTYEILAKYQKLKQKNNLLTYEDLITKTKHLLQNSSHSQWIKYKLNGFVDHVLVDEAQDTNDSQWKIINSITEEFFAGESEVNRTIFIVGDQKQSIYSFQGSQPDILSRQGNAYRKLVEQSNNKFQNIELRNSFRSLPNILTIVDKTFQKITPISHSSIKDKFLGRVELWPIFHQEKVAKDKDNFSWNLDFSAKQKPRSKELLAQHIAKTIKNWKKEHKFLPYLNRNMDYGDIMILIKKRTGGVEDVLVRALEEENVPVNKGKINLRNHLIFKDLLSISKFLLNQTDDLNLASLLKSPIFNISEEQLLQICQIKNDQHISLFQSLRDQQNFDFITKILQQIQHKFNQSPFEISELYLFILDDLSIRKKFYNEFGQQADIVIEQFILILKQKLTDGNLQRFINEVESDFTIEVDNNLDQNQVKISTIHSAKGLESPIVFLADCAHSSKSVFDASKEKILWRDNVPIWRVNSKNESVKNLQQKLREKSYAEYLRLLYVAMTRAESELYIAGFSANGKCDPGSWYSLIAQMGFETKGASLEKIMHLGQNHVFKEKKEEKKSADSDEVGEFSENYKAGILEKREQVIYPSMIDKNINVSESGDNFKKGAIIHRLLEYQIKLKRFDELQAESFLKKFNLTKEEIQETLQKTQNVIKGRYLQRLLRLEHRSEIAIMAKNADREIISAVVDLVIFSQKQILILDFKSDVDRRNEAKYIKQIEIYRQYFQKAYSNKIVNGKILWI